LAAAGWGIHKMPSGMDNRDFYAKNSYMSDYISASRSTFDGSSIEVMQLTLFKRQDQHRELFTPKSQGAFQRLMAEFSAREDVLNVVNWAADMNTTATASGESLINDETVVAFTDQNTQYKEYIKIFDDNAKKVEEVTTAITFLQPYSATAKEAQYREFTKLLRDFEPMPGKSKVQQSRDLAANCPHKFRVCGDNFDVWIAGKSFVIYISQYDTLQTQLLQSAYVSVYGVFLAMTIILPWTAAIICSLNLCMCVTNIIGFLYYIGESYNFVTTAICILSVGLCVDYSVHIMHVFLHCRGTKYERINTALTEIGPSIVNGGITSIIGVLLCLAGDAKSIVMFGGMAIMVVIFGLFQGLVVLPVLLAVMGHKISQKGYMMANPMGFAFLGVIIWSMDCAWCFG